METHLEGNQPIYMQIMDAIRLSVISGEMESGQKIPSVRDLAQNFNVNPNTMQRALSELEREGVLISERTTGRFVTKDISFIREMKMQEAEKAAAEFMAKMAALGFSEKDLAGFFREIEEGKVG